MTKHAEKRRPTPIVHHPSDALDSFGCYDSSNHAWKSFDCLISQQVTDFELSHPHYLQKLAATTRRSSLTESR
jgi:hypothetical protein